MACGLLFHVHHDWANLVSFSGGSFQQQTVDKSPAPFLQYQLLTACTRTVLQLRWVDAYIVELRFVCTGLCPSSETGN